MRIAFLTVEFVTEPNRLAGAANFLARAAEAVRDLGHEPEIFTWSPTSGTTEYKGIPVHRVSWAAPSLIFRVVNRLTFRRLHHPLQVLDMQRHMARALGERHKDAPFDVAHASGSGCTAFAARKVGLPTVVRYSGYQPEWSRLQGEGLTPANRMVCSFEAMAGRRASRCYAPSRVVARLFGSRHRLNVDVILPPFVLDLLPKEFDTATADSVSKPYILCFGPLNYRKGVDILAKALPAVMNEDQAVTMVFAGEDRGVDGRSARATILEAVGPSFADRVCFLGQLPHAKLYPLVQHATCIVVPSRLDNIPNTCLESMAFGRVVVGTTGSSLEEIIHDGESGFLVPQENPAALAGAISSVLSMQADTLSRMGERAKARIGELGPENSGRVLCDYLEDTIRCCPIKRDIAQKK